MTAIFEEIMQGVVQAIGVDACPHAYGPHHIAERTTDLPNIVWIRQQAQVQDAVKNGTDPDPRIFSKAVNMVIHVRARTEEEADGLVDTELRGLRQVLKSTIKPATIEPNAANDQAKTYGHVQNLTVQIAIPVHDKPRPKAHISDFSIDPMPPQDGWITYQA